MASTLGRFTRDTKNHRKTFQTIEQLRMAMDPSEFVDAPKAHRTSDPGTSSIFTSVSTLFGFVDFAAALHDVSDENRIFISLIDRVRHDLDEAFRLRRCRRVADHFANYPRERTWIQGTILGVQRALNDLGLYVENARVDMDLRVEVKMKHKFEWVLRNQQKLITRQIALSTCHQSLVVAIQAMQGVEMGIGGSGNTSTPLLLAERPDSEGEAEDALLGPYTRRKRRSLSARNNLQVTAREIEIASENLPEPVTIMPVALPPIASSDDSIRPHLSLRGSSGYFPSLPILQQNRKPYSELPGCLPASQSMPDLSVNERITPSQVQRQPIRRKPIRRRPVVSNPKPLPFLPRQPSLRSGLSEWIIPWNEVQSVQSEKIVDAASPTSLNTSTVVSSADTVSSAEATSPDKDRPPEQVGLMPSERGVLTPSKQGGLMPSEQRGHMPAHERRRLAHTRRLAAAYDDDD